MNKHLRLVSALSFISAFAVGQSAFAAGFEKAIMFGGETSGVAGIASSYIEGSQALYFNPAGLVSSKANAKDVSLNVSPTMLNYNSSVLSTGEQQTSNHTEFPFSLMWGQTLGDKLGYGVGVYTSAGGYGDFTNNQGAESKLDLAIIEASAGIAYKIMDNLKIGAAYRVSMVSANLDVSTNGGVPAGDAQLTSLKGTNAAGWKIGAQYKIWDRWDVGLNYRSEVDFRAKGSYNATGGGDVTVGSALPAAWDLGTSFYVADNWRMFVQYDFTQYSKVTNLSVDSAAGNVPLALNFKDQHDARIAAEYKGWSWPVRFGYIYESRVTGHAHSLPSLVPPSAGNTVTVGTGQNFTFGGQALRVDGGLEYTWYNGSSSGTTGGAANFDYTAGSNSLAEMAVHLGASYMF